jgi:hypothetical protein
LRERESKIGKHGRADLLERWDFGRDLVAQRIGKKLPKGLLKLVMNGVGVSRQDLQARMKFAVAYRDEAALSNALDKYPTWREMVRHGLTTQRRSTPHSLPSKDQRILATLNDLSPEDVGDPVQFARSLQREARRFLDPSGKRAVAPVAA